jgi:uncharacterized membrane-anchored protein YitT (DUF2179 family)
LLIKQKNNLKIKNVILEYSQIGVGILLASIGLKAFLLPNGFLDGGVTGIALLINSKLDIDISYLLVGLSTPFLVMGYFTLSRRIAVKSAFTIIALAIFIQLENFSIVTEDKLLISIFGGLFVGMGIGITIRNGAVLDGSEILGIFIHDRFGIDIGKFILLFNVVLFGITAIVLSVEVAMYSILTYIVTAKVTDFVIEGFENFIGVLVISKHHEALKMEIAKNVGSGMTIYRAEKGVGSQGETGDMMIINTVINRIDIRKMYRTIDSVDEGAFVVEYDVNNVRGGVMRRYLSKKKDKELPAEMRV